VAVLSPSGRAASAFPDVLDLGLARLREHFELVPVEFPTTRAPEASPEQRADDVLAAFADAQIKAVMTTIGGEDELKVLAHLDPAKLAENPKPFFGYSDNTNLLLYLWNAGLVSYHGAAIMVQLGRAGSMNAATRESLANALFGSGTCVLAPPEETSDEERSWRDSAELSLEPRMFPARPWSWHGPKVKVSGQAWGGNLEIVDFHLRAGRYLLRPEAYDGAVLFLETSEEMPDATYVRRLLMCMGERGLLQRFAAVVWGRPKAWSFEQPNPDAAKQEYVDSQRETVLAALAEYHPDVPLVFGVDFGHTDPQYVIPIGGEVTVDGKQERIEVRY
jgi:muramoyltetrapeptide carboxypeptidase LdcA involved in peptidoglycan recycling